MLRVKECQEVAQGIFKTSVVNVFQSSLSKDHYKLGLFRDGEKFSIDVVYFDDFHSLSSLSKSRKIDN